MFLVIALCFSNGVRLVGTDKKRHTNGRFKKQAKKVSKSRYMYVSIPRKVRINDRFGGGSHYFTTFDRKLVRV